MKTYYPGQTLGVSKTGVREMISLATSVEGRGTLIDTAIKIVSVSNCAKSRHVSNRLNRRSSQQQRIDDNGTPNFVMHKPVSAICTVGYRVEGKVNGVSVLFLVDSGAFVMLIRKDAWERVNPLQQVLSVRTGPSLVGLDQVSSEWTKRYCKFAVKQRSVSL